jgi:oligogalacturonide transport system substrate-binding protein
MKRHIGRLVILSALGFTASAMAAEELRFSWWGGNSRHEATLKMIKLFEEKNPGVTIKGEYGGFSGYQDRLTTQIGGNSEPDIMQLNWAWITNYSKDGNGFYDLNKSRNLIKMSDFSAEEIRMGMVKGKLNALSSGFTARIFIWNKDSLTKAGVKMPTTWDELFSAGKTFRAKSDNKGWLLDGENYDMLLLTQSYIFQKYGTPYIDPIEPKVAMSQAALTEWTSMYKRLMDENVAMPLPVRASNGAADRPNEQLQEWAGGNIGGLYTWDSTIVQRGSTLPNKGQELDIGPFLTLKGAKNSGMFGRPALVFAVSKNSKYPETAVKFLNFMLTDPEAGKTLGMTRGIPASDAIANMLLKEGMIGPAELKAWQQVRNQKNSGKITLPSPLFEHARMQAFVKQTFEQVAYGRLSPEDAAKTLLTEGNSLLEKIK